MDTLRQRFLEGMSRAAATVSIVTTDGSGGRAGVTVSAMSSVSADTPSLLVCVHRQSAASAAIRTNGVFCVNVLRDDQSQIADIFAGRRKTPSGDKFEGGQWKTLRTGSPALADPLVAFDCTVQKAIEFGSHWIFIGELADVVTTDADPPLIYANRAYGTPVSLDRFYALAADTGEGGASEIVRMGCMVSLGPYFVPGLLGEFNRLHPDIAIELIEGDQEKVVAHLERKFIALALTYDFELGDEIETELLAEMLPYCLLPASHPLAAKTAVSLNDLVDQPMILLDLPRTRAYPPSLFAAIGREPTIRHRSTSFEMVRSMVANGFGYALLTTKPANNMSYDGRALVTRPLVERVPTHRLVLARPRQVPLDPRAELLAAHCRTYFQQAAHAATADDAA